jgi:hemerythrin superfamily protein
MNARLIHDHEDLDEVLGEIFAALDISHVKRSHAHLDLFWARLGVHIRVEHLHLFPAILRALMENPKSEVDDAPSLTEAQNAIEELRHDHDFFMRELSRAISLMRELLAQADRKSAVRKMKIVRERVVIVSERLAAHNKLEENQVYLWAGSLLSEAEQSRLAAQLQNELENMPPRFAEDTKPDF